MRPGKDAVLRLVAESLRPVDPLALFWLGISQIEILPEAAEHELDELPAGELVAFVNTWLSHLDPEGAQTAITWSADGIRLVFHARGRTAEGKGDPSWPSLNLLQPVLHEVVLASGDRLRLIDLTVDQLRELALGELPLARSSVSDPDWFRVIADQLDHFGLPEVAAAGPTQIHSWAEVLGLT